MAYDYVKRAYGVNPVIGERVRHMETMRTGTIASDRSAGAYVMVGFDGDNFALPSHPTALDYNPVEKAATEPQAGLSGDEAEGVVDPIPPPYGEKA